MRGFLPDCPVWKGQEVNFTHVKRDGMAVFYQSDKFWTRTPTFITQELRECNCPWLQYAVGDDLLVGELWLPGKKASAVKSALANRDPSLRWDIFAVLNPGLENASLDAIDRFVTGRGLTFLPFFKGVYDADLQHLSPDVEGYVLKEYNAQGWYKLKPVKTIDLVVTGFKDGNGKNLGLTGSLVCSVVEGYEVACVGGMDDATRAEISDDEERYRGRVVEVAYQYVGSKGRLRHPRFIRFRDDKRADECIVNQDTDLWEYWHVEGMQ